MESAGVQLSLVSEKPDPWAKLRGFIDEHQALLLDHNVATEDLQFEDGKIIYDEVRYDLFDLGWSTMCGRMEPVFGSRRPPAFYIRHLPMELQEKLVRHHFSECPEKRHFLRCKASDDGPFIRAFLSETYQRGRFDYVDFVDIVVKDFRERMEGFRPVAYDVGEKIFQLKTLSDIVIPDPVEASMHVGVSFVDSEVGAGSVIIRPFVRHKTRGHDMFILSDAFRRRHSGPRRRRDEDGNFIDLDTAALKRGVTTDKLRITKDIKAYIEQMNEEYKTKIEEARALIFAYYNTPLPIDDWEEASLEALFEQVYRHNGSLALPKTFLKAAIAKLPEYDMPNLWGLFNAMCEVSEDTDKEVQLDREIKSSRLAQRLYRVLS